MKDVVDWCCSKANDCSDCEFHSSPHCITDLKEKIRKDKSNE